MKYSKTTRRDCICNICRVCENENGLSWDHVPPKGGIDLSSMEVRNYNNLNFRPDSPDRNIMQQGVKYRTLCKKCNSKLGSLYDDTFNRLMKDAFAYINTSLHIPFIMNIKTSPTLIIKSLLGHLLATKVDLCDTEIDNITRIYIFDKNSILPNNIHVYCWFYPYNCTIICSDKFQFNPYSGESQYYSTIKTFPLAFAISLDSHLDDLLETSTEITKYNHDNEDEFVRIPIKIINNKPYDYPESLKYSGVQLVNSNSNDIFAVKKK